MVGLIAIAAIFLVVAAIFTVVMVTGRWTGRRENDGPRFALPEHDGRSIFDGHDYQDPNPI